MKETFTTSHGSRNSLMSLVVELQANGQSGFGEAAAIPYYGVTIAQMMQALEQVRVPLQNTFSFEPEQLWENFHPLLKSFPFAHCALDMALHDLYAKLLGKPLYQLWGLSMEWIPHTSYTIGMDSVEHMIKKIKAFPWPLYKIKLGSREDVKIVRELRKCTDSPFRVDANGAWKVEETIANSFALQSLDVEFIEQPLPKTEQEGMKLVYEKAALPVMADESCMAEEDVEKCHRHFHGINIKLAKCGGISPALRMIRKARKLGMQVMMGCMTESTVGISAIAQMLPLLDYVDMDGALLLKYDVAEGVVIGPQGIRLPEENGTGVQLKPEFRSGI